MIGAREEDALLVVAAMGDMVGMAGNGESDGAAHSSWLADGRTRSQNRIAIGNWCQAPIFIGLDRKGISQSAEAVFG